MKRVLPAYFFGKKAIKKTGTTGFRNRPNPDAARLRACKRVCKNNKKKRKKR
jgi:hypothetical protein